MMHTGVINADVGVVMGMSVLVSTFTIVHWVYTSARCLEHIVLVIATIGR